MNQLMASKFEDGYQLIFFFTQPICNLYLDLTVILIAATKINLLLAITVHKIKPDYRRADSCVTIIGFHLYHIGTYGTPLTY